MRFLYLNNGEKNFSQNYRLEKQSIGEEKRGETYCVLRSTVSVSGLGTTVYFFYWFSNETRINLLNVYPSTRVQLFLKLILRNEAKTLYTAELGSCVLNIILINTCFRTKNPSICFHNSASSANKNAWKTTTAPCNLFVF